jgi:hypothetical protein
MKHGETMDPLLNQHKNFGFPSLKIPRTFQPETQQQRQELCSHCTKVYHSQELFSKSDNSQLLENC